MMNWSQRYALRSYRKSSLWLVPFVALISEQFAIRLSLFVDSHIKVPDIWPSISGATSGLQNIISVNLSFIVFTFGSLLVAIQVASGQLTPRIIATTLLGDRVISGTVGLFVFTFLFAHGALSHLEPVPPSLTMWLAGFFGLCTLAAFLYLIDYLARLLRPVSIVWRVGDEGMAVIESVYPRSLTSPQAGHPTVPRLGKPHRTILHRGTSGIILAVNVEALVQEATRSNTIIELVPRVGDFVAVGDPMFRIYGDVSGAAPKTIEFVAFGPERTIEQDSTFAFRVIVDIAIKALSKAINDPTTAVLSIDQLHRLLRKVGGRHLQDDVLCNAAGQPTVIFPTPNWEDFVQLSVSEIRIYGAENFQIARRLRAMIENLLEMLPAQRHAALEYELGLLDRSIDQLYLFAEDQALARTPDTQGLGGATPAKRA